MDLGEKAGIFGGETGQSQPNGSNQTRFSPLVEEEPYDVRGNEARATSDADEFLLFLNLLLRIIFMTFFFFFLFDFTSILEFPLTLFFSSPHLASLAFSFSNSALDILLLAFLFHLDESESFLSFFFLAEGGSVGEEAAASCVPSAADALWGSAFAASFCFFSAAAFVSLIPFTSDIGFIQRRFSGQANDRHS